QIPTALMQGPRGKAVGGAYWAAYSLSHPEYRAAVAGWYGAVATALAEVWNDPVVAWQLDNETGLLYAGGPGRWDWNPDTLARFHAWLAAEYDTLDALNRAWGSRYRDFAAIEPPRRPFRRGLLQEWTRFLEDWINEYLCWLRDTARAAGVPVPLTHNDSANFIPPINPAYKIAAGVSDLPGYDVWVKTSGRPTATDYPWGSACAPAYFRAITPPHLPLLCWQLGAGWPDPRSRAGDLALRNNVMGNLAQGMQGFSLYVAHDGSEPDGHPYGYATVLDATGQPGPRHAEMTQLLAFMRQYAADLVAADPPGADFRGTQPPPTAHFRGTQPPPTGGGAVLGFAFHFPDFRFTSDDFLPIIGQQDPVRVLALVMSAFGLYAALLAAGYGPALRLINLDTATPADLAACTTLVLPSKGLLAVATYGLVRGYVEQGGHLITCGRTPRRTLTGTPLDTRRLYPVPVRRTAFLGRLPAFAYLGWTYIVKYGLWQRRRLHALHPTGGHALDANEPLSALFYTPQAATELQDRAGQIVRGDYMRQTYRLAPKRARWTAGGQAAGYTVRVGRGSSTMIGTMPGGSLFTPQYYRLTPTERQDIRTFWTRLLADHQLIPPFRLSPGLEIEVSHRPFPGGGLLFLINRLPADQHGTLGFTSAAGMGGVPQLIFAGDDSQVRAQPDGLRVDIAGHDCVVLRWAVP
ncbi:MAG: beta-galactosidase, partial [Chloroflexota bacterium]|nr:beta-galactosidase [Chloroflexota bacterium]